MANLTDIDFLELDAVVLSQVADEMEDDVKIFDIATEAEDDFSLTQEVLKVEKDLDIPGCSTLSQTIQKNEVESEDFNAYEFGNFLLVEDMKQFVKAEVVEKENQIMQPSYNDAKPRFQAPVSVEEINNLITNQANANTVKNTKWAMGIFNEWRLSRGQFGDVIPDLHEMQPVSLDFWLQRFVLEVRKKNGNEYPPRSVYLIVCGLLRYLRDKGVHNLNFLNEQDGRFGNFRRVLDARMKELLSKGLGTNIRKADPVSIQDEDKLWTLGVFGQSDSISLQHTVFFYTCKLFGLRGRDEHRNLDCSQFQIGTDSTGKYLRFIGRSNKTYQGGLGQIRLANKDLKHYSDGGQRCIVSHFETYLEALGKEGVFYRKPLAGNGEMKFRYGNQPLGVNKLDSLMKEICAKGGLVGNYSNHSGKRTCATQVYRAGIDEQEIMGRTGHRSSAVREYKTTDGNIQRRVSSVLNPPSSAIDAMDKSSMEPSEKIIKLENEHIRSNSKECNRSSFNFLSYITNTKGSVTFSNCNFNF